MFKRSLRLIYVLLVLISGASVLAQDSRPHTGTLIKDTVRGGLGELTIINDNHNLDALVMLTSPDKVPQISVFIRSGELLKISGIADGTYDVYFKLGNKWDGSSAKFTENGGHYRLDRPLVFETTRTSTSHTIKTGYTTWTVALEEAVPDANIAARKVAVSEDEFPI